MALTGGVAPTPNYEFALNSERYSDITLLLEVVGVDGSSRSGSGSELGDSTVFNPTRPDLVAAEPLPGSGDPSTPGTVHINKRPRLDNGAATEAGGEATEAGAAAEAKETEEPEGKELGDSTVVNPTRPDLVAAEPVPGSGDPSTPATVHIKKRPRLDNGAAKEAGEATEAGAAEEAKEAEEPEGKGTPVLRVERMIVCSVILAAQSPFFQKLFDSTFRESKQKEVKLRINAADVYAIRELVYFLYCGSFNTNDPIHIISILDLADMYQVEAATRHCISVLQRIPMTPEIAIMYLNHPVSSGLENLFKPVKLSAVSFFANRFRDILKSNDELMTMPLSVIRAVFVSSLIVAPCEDSIFQFLLKWVATHYSDLTQRKSVFNNALIPLVRFVHLSCWQLQKLLGCDLLDLTRFSVGIVYALLFKADAAFSQPRLRLQHWNYSPRCYTMKALKITHFEQPFYQCICYMDLKREECLSLFPKNHVSSEAFTIARHQLLVKANCNQEGADHHFGVYLSIHNFSQPVTVRVEIGVRRRPGFFQREFGGVGTFTSGDQSLGALRLFPWTQLVADDCPFFVKGKLHLMVEVTLIAQQPQVQQQQQPQIQQQQQPQQQQQ